MACCPRTPLEPLAGIGCALRALGLARRFGSLERHCGAFLASEALGGGSDPASCIARTGSRERFGLGLSARFRRCLRDRFLRRSLFRSRSRRVSDRVLLHAVLQRFHDLGLFSPVGESIGHLVRNRCGRIMGCTRAGVAARRGTAGSVGATQSVARVWSLLRTSSAF